MLKILKRIKNYVFVFALLAVVFVFCPIEAKAAELPEIKSIETTQSAYLDEKGYYGVSVGVNFTISKKSKDKNLVFEVYRSTSENGVYKKTGEISAVSSKTQYTFWDKSRYLMPKKTYYYKVRAVSGKTKGTYSSSSKIKLKLGDAKVTGISYVAEDKSICICFADPFEVNNGVDDYETDYKKILNIYTIYRSESPNGKYKKIGTAPVIAGRYYDTDIEEGKAYYYKVKAGYYNRKIEKSVAGKFVDAGSQIAVDFTVSSKIKDGKVNLKWTKIKDAKYYIYDDRYMYSSSLIAKTKKSSYTYDMEKKDHQWFSVVVYLKIDGKYTKTSLEQTVSVDIFSPKIKNLVKEKKRVSGTLTWNKVDKADGYIIKNYDGVNWVTLAKIEDNNITSYEFNGLKNDAFLFCYYDGKKVSDDYAFESEIEEETQIETSVTVQQLSTSKVKVSWPEVIGAENYKVYRVSGYKSAAYIDLEDEWTLSHYVGNTTSTSIIDSNAMPGMDYLYIVQADKVDGVSLNAPDMYSDSVTLTVDKPVLKSIKNKSAKSATITWKKTKGADEYVIYRSTKKNGTYKAVATIKGTSYVDKKLSKGKTYYYKIKAINVNDFGIRTESKFSKVKSVEIKK